MGETGRKEVGGCLGVVHQFEPRYSRRLPEIVAEHAREGLFVTVGELENVYECDVCVKCGKKVSHDPR